jgi:hypothetical protein
MVMAVIPGNIALSIILGISLKKVWSAINVLQFLIYLNQWNLSLPANTDKFVGYIKFIARGEFIPKDKILNKVLPLFRIPQSNDKSIMFTRFLIIILVGVAVVAIVVGLLVYLCRNKNTRLSRELNNVKDKIFWNIIIRTII